MRFNSNPVLIATLACLNLMLAATAIGQETLTPNGIADQRQNAYALTNANIYRPDGTIQSDGTLLISEGRIVEIRSGSSVPQDYFEIDLSGQYLYPGLIDIYTDYGVPDLEEDADDNGAGENLFPSGQAINVNNAIRSHYRAGLEFIPNEETRAELREAGFSTVLSLRADGIARGTSALVTLANKNANEAMLMADAAAHYSLSKGSSNQAMPSSLMGAIALLRQTYLDASWYERQNPKPFIDESLAGWNRYQDLPQIMEISNWQQLLTSDRVGEEFSTQYIFKTQGDSYKRLDLIKATGATLIVPVNFPEAPKVDDVLDTDDVSLADLKHWELAPHNLHLLAEADIPFAITSSESGDSFWKNLRAAVANGLPEDKAIDALTRIPAQILGVEELLGQLVPGGVANFIVSSKELFESDSRILENWIHGDRFIIETDLDARSGNYQLTVAMQAYELKLDFGAGDVSGEITDLDGGESEKVNIELIDDLIALNFVSDDQGNRTRLTGWSTDIGWQGNGQRPNGEWVDWQLRQVQSEEEVSPNPEQVEAAALDLPGAIIYPFVAYGAESLPDAEDVLIRNATVWTNENAGNLVTDVLVRDGKIVAIGNGMPAVNVIEIDAQGKHLTPGIIDEHSHIALFNINETATNSSMVRMPDVVDSESINIYRNLAGGVTAAQLLHGSANPIGGQSALIKMRWGQPAPDLLIEGADKFIKFALGENVKRSRNPSSIRYPQTRMGVEQVFVNAFTQAREYETRWSEYNSLPATQRDNGNPPRRDLVHETMLEILHAERYVTSHSYVQSEINMLMNVANSFDFNINTFTHILEGYKVADKMAQHGAGGSTFADWWGYKWEAYQAIPYNAALMHQAGVVTAINSDDAEMSRRLNQEAAKSVKYGGMSEVDAFKQVTLNPAKLLHLDERMGSIRIGKDADLVLWSDHPLSVYAVAEKTWVDGILYFDRDRDSQLRQQIAEERARIIAAIGRDSSTANGTSNAQEPAL